MKKFIAGVIVGFLLSFSTTALAESQIRLIVDDREIKCDVPPQIINGRTLVPARFVAEALGANVEWDEANRAVIISTYNTHYVKLKFTNGVTVSPLNGGGINIKINKEKLPSGMKNFSKMMASGIGDGYPSPKTISYIVEECIKQHRYVEYDIENGFDEGAETPYYVIMLFDDNGNFLGYCITGHP